MSRIYYTEQAKHGQFMVCTIRFQGREFVFRLESRLLHEVTLQSVTIFFLHVTFLDSFNFHGPFGAVYHACMNVGY